MLKSPDWHIPQLAFTPSGTFPNWFSSGDKIPQLPIHLFDSAHFFLFSSSEIQNLAEIKKNHKLIHRKRFTSILTLWMKFLLVSFENFSFDQSLYPWKMVIKIGWNGDYKVPQIVAYWKIWPFVRKLCLNWRKLRPTSKLYCQQTSGYNQNWASKEKICKHRKSNF